MWDVPDDEIPKLDKHEGVGYGYLKTTCRFLVDGDERDVLVYVADSDYVDEALVPYKWYFDLVVAGAEQNNLPRDYLSALRAVPFTRDPEPDRKTRLEALEALEKYRKSTEESEHIPERDK
jgi:hypothetical protein